MSNKKNVKLIFVLGLIGLTTLFISLNLKTAPSSPVYPIVQKIQSSLNTGSNVRLSDIGDFDKVCVFWQDDSDEGFAKGGMDKFLSDKNINLDKSNFEDENPDHILLFIKGNKALGVENWKFVGKSVRGYLVFDGYEDKRNLCLSWSKALISNNLYISELE